MIDVSYFGQKRRNRYSPHTVQSIPNNNLNPIKYIYRKIIFIIKIYLKKLNLLFATYYLIYQYIILICIIIYIILFLNIIYETKIGKSKISIIYTLFMII